MANNVRDFTVNSLQQFYNKLNNDILPTYASMSYVESAYAYILDEIVDNEYVIAQTFNSHNDRITILENAGYITSETQPDWNVTNTSSPAYIKNKPTIPSIAGLATEQYVDEEILANATTESTVSGWGFTKNTGTLTGVTFNGVDASVTNGVASITATIPPDNVFIIPVTKSGTSYTTTLSRTDIRNAMDAGKLLFVLYNRMVMPLRSYDSDDYGDWYFTIVNNTYICTMHLVSNGNGNISCYYSETALPSAITESTVAGWGFTKNEGTLTSETDPTVASYIKSITQENINAWNSYANVQSDWNVTDTSSVSYIKNKPTIPSTAGLATESYVNTKVAGIVNSAPEALDTLNELASALGNDANFSTTVATQIGERISKTELAGLGYVTQTTLSAQGYLTTETKANWNETNTNSAAYIQNKPTIPTKVSDLTDDVVSGNYLPRSGGSMNNGAHIELSLGDENDYTILSGGSIYMEDYDEEIGTNYGIYTIRARGKSILIPGNDWNGAPPSSVNYTDTFALLSDIPAAVTESTLTGWGFTKNAGTITGITMNGSSKGTSGVIDLGTVLTAHQDISGKQDTITDLATIRSNASAGAAKVSANDSTITIQKGGTNVDTFTTNASSNKTINIPNELPTYSSSDAGKILSINSSGQLVWVTPVNIYSGTGDPSNSMGNDGDIYLQS